MPIPDEFEALMLPALEACEGGRQQRLSAIRRKVAQAEGFSVEDRRKKYPSGGKIYASRMTNAMRYMLDIGLLKRVRHGIYRTTDKGDRLLSSNPSRTDIDRLLAECPDYLELTLHRTARRLASTREADVLRRVHGAPPAILGRVVEDLLDVMGYRVGDAMKSGAGRFGDRGIDCTIREDALGPDTVYVRVRKYPEGKAVDANDLHDFALAVGAADATKGVFVTTADFTSAAETYVERSPIRIVRIGGEKLAQLMVLHGVGVRTRAQYEVKRIDEDYFGVEAT